MSKNKENNNNTVGVVKRLKIIIKLFFVYIKSCFNDFIQNYQDIKFRYKIEKHKELLKIQEDLDII